MIRQLILSAAIIACLCAHAAQAELRLTVYGSPAASLDREATAREDAEETAGAATVADDSAWQGQRATTLKDMTDYIPGVYTQARNGAESYRLALRGAGLANTFQGRGLLVMQDGVPINFADGEFEFPVIDPWLVKYAVVLPGANALAEGASTLGGAIDLVTQNGRTAPGLRLRGESGSFGTLHGMVSGGASDKDSDMFAAVTGFHQDGFREHNEHDIGRLNGNFGWRPSQNIEHRVNISHTVSRPEIPGAIRLSEIAADPSQANPNNVAGRFARDLDITRLSERMAWRDGAHKLETTVYYTYRQLDNPVTTYILEHNNDAGARVKYTHDAGGDKWLLGANIAYGTQDESRFANVGGNTGAHILDRDLDALTSEAYAQYDRLLAGRLHGIASVQGAYDTRNIEETFPASAQQNRSFAGFNPRLGLRYDLADGQVFANISRSLEPPTWAELSGGNAPGFNDLDAQTATTAEIGARGNWRGFDASLALYHSWLRDEFVNYEFAPGVTDTINAARTRHTGAELGIGGDLLHDLVRDGDALQLRGAYTWSHFNLDGDALYNDNQLPGMPEHYFRGEIAYRHPSGVTIGPNIEAASAYPVDLTNTLDAPGYAIFGARAAWQHDRGDVYIDLRNIADKHYTATSNVVPNANGVDGRFFYPGEGRAVYAGFSLRF